jgi:hypothetical protein
MDNASTGGGNSNTVSGRGAGDGVIGPQKKK